jgi:hypothetical protein
VSQGRAAAMRVRQRELCQGKVAFDSFELAKQAAQRRRRQGKRLAYRCKGCRRWHLCGVHRHDHEGQR